MRSWARTANELAAGAGARIRIDSADSCMCRQFGLSILQGNTLQIQYRSARTSPGHETSSRFTTLLLLSILKLSCRVW
jgi:hypothetical protein